MNKKKISKIFYIALVIVIFFTILILMQTSVIGLSENVIEGRGIFDAKLEYYNSDYFYETIGMMRNEDIRDYHIFHIFDNIFVISYYLLMSIIIFPVLSQKNKKFSYIIPLFPALFDFIENTSIEILLIKFPKEFGYAKVVGIFTCLKWYSGFLWFIIFLILFVIYLIKRFNKKNT